MPTVRLSNITYPGQSPWVLMGAQPVAVSWVVGAFHKFENPAVFYQTQGDSAVPNGFGVSVVSHDGTNCMVDVTFPDIDQEIFGGLFSHSDNVFLGNNWQWQVGVSVAGEFYLFVSDGLNAWPRTFDGTDPSSGGRPAQYMGYTDLTVPGDAVGAHIVSALWWFADALGGFATTYGAVADTIMLRFLDVAPPTSLTAGGDLLVTDNFGRRLNVGAGPITGSTSFPPVPAWGVLFNPLQTVGSQSDDAALIGIDALSANDLPSQWGFRMSIFDIVDDPPTFSWTVTDAVGATVATSTAYTWSLVLKPGSYTATLTANWIGSISGANTKTFTSTLSIADAHFLGMTTDAKREIFVAINQQSGETDDGGIKEIVTFCVNGNGIQQLATIPGQFGPSLCKGPDNTLYMLARRWDDYNSYLYISRDKGATFIEVGVAWTPEYRRPTLTLSGDGGFISVAISPDEIPGYLVYKYSPDGIDWSMEPVRIGLRTLANARCCIFQRYNDIMLCATDGYGIWKSLDYGRTWTVLTNAVSTVNPMSALNPPNAALCQTGDGGFLSYTNEFCYSPDGIDWTGPRNVATGAEFQRTFVQLAQLWENRSSDIALVGYTFFEGLTVPGYGVSHDMGRSFVNAGGL